MSKFNLTFDTLRNANTFRLPLFKNRRGEVAHTELDGSDWSPNDWMTAVTGEVGEAAGILKQLRRGDFKIDDEVDVKGVKMTARQWLATEFADIVTYVDILAKQFSIDLGDAVSEKFNDVSNRIGVDVKITEPWPHAMDDGNTASVRVPK